MNRFLAFLMVIGCGSSTSEASRVVTAFQLAEQGDLRAQTMCLSLKNKSSIGECVALYASRSHNRDVCFDVDGFWRDECNFMWAEAEFRAHPDSQAGSLCAFSGALIDDCNRHLEKQLNMRKPNSPLPWKERLRHHQPLSIAPCARDPECEDVVVSLLVGRWQRELTDPTIRGSLCSGQPATGRFAWDPSPPLDAAMAALRARHCAHP